MPKVNVYLPDELAAAVRAEKLPMSAVCQDALRAALARSVATTVPPADAHEIAARLLLTEQLDDRDDYLAGYEAGAKWARDRARLRELRALVRRRDAGVVVIDVDAIAPTLLGFLANCFADRDADPEWFEQLDTDEPFGRGVVDGAIDIHTEVLPYLNELKGTRR